MLNLDNARSVAITPALGSTDECSVVATFGALWLNADLEKNELWNSAVIYTGSKMACTEMLTRLGRRLDAESPS